MCVLICIFVRGRYQWVTHNQLIENFHSSLPNCSSGNGWRSASGQKLPLASFSSLNFFVNSKVFVNLSLVEVFWWIKNKKTASRVVVLPTKGCFCSISINQFSVRLVLWEIGIWTIPKLCYYSCGATPRVLFILPGKYFSAENVFQPWSIIFPLFSNIEIEQLKFNI